MARKKISDNVSAKLEEAVQNAFKEIEGTDIEKPKQKRTKTKVETKIEVNHPKDENVIFKCNTPSHITAVVDWDIDNDNVDLPKYIEIPNNILVNDYNNETVSEWLTNTFTHRHKGFSLSWPGRHDTLEQFCEWEIEKAHLNNKEDPDFDYRNFYQKGEKVYLVRYYERLKTKELTCVKLRTIYPRLMIGVIEGKNCQCIGLSDRDNIFYNHNDALKLYKSINANVEPTTTEDNNDE